VNSKTPRLDISESYDTPFIPFLFFRAQKKKTNPKSANAVCDSKDFFRKE
jgi:hypothetical protein